MGLIQDKSSLQVFTVHLSSTDPHFDVKGQGRLGDGDAIITRSTITPKAF